jgi:catalase
MRSVRPFGALLALSLLAAPIALAPLTQARADDPPLSTRIINQLNAIFGRIPHTRANHAKGVVFEGTFTPAPGAADFSKAAFLTGAPTPITVRFSNSGGLPEVPDTHPSTGGVRGIAVKFHLAGNGEADLVGINTNGFPVSNGDDFLAFLTAVGNTKPDSPHPSPVEQFLGAHPAAVTWIHMPKPMPVSYATEAFFGVNAFKYTNAKGEVHYGRWHITPVDGAKFVTDEEAAKREPNALADLTHDAVAKGPVSFKLSIQVAAEGDPTDDATKVWPDSRPLVELGTITLTKADDTAAVQNKLLFLPTRVPDGIAISGDPLLNVRTAAYLVSFGRRQQP